MQINRKYAQEIALETLEILRRGFYQIKDENVYIKDLLQKAIDGTSSYPPSYDLLDISPGNKDTNIEVANETTLTAAKRLVEEGFYTAALNFASAKNAGGGFRSGARAQEESLARSSGLYQCIVGNGMYTFHRARKDPMYTNYAIYSPNVPVFKMDDGTLLTKPYLCSFITSPAVNAGALRKRKSARREEIRNAMRERVVKVLAIAAIHKHDALVLGAWGCGVFGNDSREVAELFNKALSENFTGVFSKVIFAVTDWSKNKRFIGPFYEVFPAKKMAKKN